MNHFFQKEVNSHPLRGDTKYFSTLFDNYHKQLYAFAYRYLKSQEETEDAVQYTFMKIWEKRDEILFDDDIKNLMFTIIRNYILNILRHRDVIKGYTIDIESSENMVMDNVADDLYHKEIYEYLEKIVNDLSPQRKLIYELKVNKGLTNQEIATQLKLSLATVKSHYSSIIKIISAEMKKAFYVLLLLIISILS